MEKYWDFYFTFPNSMFSLLQVNGSGFAAYYDACQVDPSLSWKVWFAMCFVKEFDRTVVHSMNFSLSIKVLMILTAWCNTGYQVAADNYIAANHNERNPNSRRQWVLAFSGFCISIHLIWAALSVSHETFAKRQLDSLLNLVLPVSSYPTMVAAS